MRNTELKRLSEFTGSIAGSRLLVIIMIMVYFPVIETMAQGNLLITPRRVVFEGPKKIQELNLANTGQDTATYSISIIQYRMKEDGTFEQITSPDPGQQFADPYIRFFPRSVTLAPNEAQVVKMQLNKTGELPEGEYRSHVYFRAVPDQKPLGEEELPVDTGTISVQITPIFGVTIPVIIRIGTSDTKVSLSDLTYENVEDTIHRLSMRFNRSGNMSVYGDIEVVHISPQGKKTPAGLVKGIAVYTPNTYRTFRMDLYTIEKVDYTSGKLQVTYLEQSDAKPAIIAEAVLNLP